jgi:hypothetical protein
MGDGVTCNDLCLELFVMIALVSFLPLLLYSSLSHSTTAARILEHSCNLSFVKSLSQINLFLSIACLAPIKVPLP